MNLESRFLTLVQQFAQHLLSVKSVPWYLSRDGLPTMTEHSICLSLCPGLHPCAILQLLSCSAAASGSALAIGLCEDKVRSRLALRLSVRKYSN